MLKIRPFEWSDAEALFERNKESEIQEQAIAPLPETLEDMVQQYSRMLESGHIILVAEDDGKIAGDVFVRPSRGRMSHVGNIGVYLKKEFWGKGMGTKLVKEAMKEAKKRGFKKIVYTARNTNKRSINLVKDLKFTFVGKMKKHVRVGNKYYDRLIFEKLL